MYGKLFASMYDGTLYGQWQAIVTLQQLVILADEDGVVDITPPALAAKTSIPLEIIEKGLEQLSQPDKYSRSTDEDGRRIVPIDENRPWGWRIVNYRHYRDLASREDKKRKDRQRIAEKRNKSNDVADCRKVSQGVADSRKESRPVVNVAHTDTDTDTGKEDLPDGRCASPGGEAPEEPLLLNGSTREQTPYQAIVDLFRTHCPSLPDVVKLTPARKQAIRARWRNELKTLQAWEGFFQTVEMSDFLTGRAPPTGGRQRPWRADLDFLVKQSNCLKVIEGKYDE